MWSIYEKSKNNFYSCSGFKNKIGKFSYYFKSIINSLMSSSENQVEDWRESDEYALENLCHKTFEMEEGLSVSPQTTTINR